MVGVFGQALFGDPVECDGQARIGARRPRRRGGDVAPVLLLEAVARLRPAEREAIALVHWEQFPNDHVYYIPLSCMVPAGADNIVVAGRCVDGDSHALSAIRVMGPCIAMGAAAAHALSLAGTGSVHDIELAKFQEGLHDNLDRRD